MWAFHAWFHVELGTETEARSIVMNLDGDDPTSVVEFKNEKLKMKNEASDDAAWYDLNGRRYVKRPSKKGIYIHGGEKIVVN